MRRARHAPPIRALPGVRFFRSVALFQFRAGSLWRRFARSALPFRALLGRCVRRSALPARGGGPAVPLGGRRTEGRWGGPASALSRAVPAALLQLGSDDQPSWGRNSSFRLLDCLIFSVAAGETQPLQQEHARTVDLRLRSLPIAKPEIAFTALRTFAIRGMGIGGFPLCRGTVRRRATRAPRNEHQFPYRIEGPIAQFASFTALSTQRVAPRASATGGDGVGVVRRAGGTGAPRCNCGSGKTGVPFGVPGICRSALFIPARMICIVSI